jgi:hypothetical protein
MASNYIPPYKSDGTPNVRRADTPNAKAKYPCGYCGYPKASPEPYTCPGCGRRPNEPTQKKDSDHYSGGRGNGGSSGADAFNGLLVFVGGAIILLAIFCPPVGIPAISLFAIGKLISSFGKN